MPSNPYSRIRLRHRARSRRVLRRRGDAAHIVALAAADCDGFVRWTQRGIELAESRDEAEYWLGRLLNDLGWELYESGDFTGALDAFERALGARERDPANASAIEIARYAVGKALRARHRSEEAIPLLEQAVAWATGEGAHNGWFHEELAKEYAAVGVRVKLVSKRGWHCRSSSRRIRHSRTMRSA